MGHEFPAGHNLTGYLFASASHVRLLPWSSPAALEQVMGILLHHGRGHDLSKGAILPHPGRDLIPGMLLAIHDVASYVEWGRWLQWLLKQTNSRSLLQLS